MFKKTLLALSLTLWALPLPLGAQNASAKTPAASGKTDDAPQSNRFWQASIGGGHYMVALERISAISRHKYVLDGAVIVDEVTVDALGQALARFYFITPITAATSGSGVGNTASRLVDRGQTLIEGAAQKAGTDVHQMVIKKFPETTHAHTIEYRVLSEQELTGLYTSIRTAWESGRGRSFTVK